jgi:hypothetical protein
MRRFAYGTLVALALALGACSETEPADEPGVEEPAVDEPRAGEDERE